ncbi:hypothetical protein BC835DRAFT_368697 [Cytidiella melzeri]|nr:hypothetical protein BC835DRAFT_368697 [Cytidiella melzeri]
MCHPDAHATATWNNNESGLQNPRAVRWRTMTCHTWHVCYLHTDSRITHHKSWHTLILFSSCIASRTVYPNACLEDNMNKWPARVWQPLSPSRPVFEAAVADCNCTLHVPASARQQYEPTPDHCHCVPTITRVRTPTGWRRQRTNTKAISVQYLFSLYRKNGSDRLVDSLALC